MQDADPHDVLTEAWLQAPVPSQLPVLPQVPLAAQPVEGVPAATLAQVPVPAPQAWQVGQAATPQQTPSVQKPVPHSLAEAQDWPDPFLGMQLPPAPEQ